jgi:alpha-L-arabinofuranosidase
MFSKRMIIGAVLLFILFSCEKNDQEIDNSDNDPPKLQTITVHNTIMHQIDENIMGQFLERPSWGGEKGPEGALIPGTNQLQPAVLDSLKTIFVPVMRFPGGTDVEIMDWTDMISNAPGRQSSDRPVSTGVRGDEITNNFGWDEYYELAKELGSETVMVLNLTDAMENPDKADEYALHNVGLLAYCNARPGQPLPTGMPDWAAVRKANGYTEPFNFEYVQIGNELWLNRYSNINNAENFVINVEKYVDLIEAIDPNVKVIADCWNDNIYSAIQSRLGDRIDYLTYHVYKPWEIKEIKRNGSIVDGKTVPPEDIWQAMVAPLSCNDEGQVYEVHKPIDLIRSNGSNYKAAITEWNWNGWFSTPVSVNPKMAHGIGAANFIHNLFRQADVVALANQSLLVGTSWGITGLRADATAAQLPEFLPQGMAARFYANHLGHSFHSISLENLEFYNQPYELQGIKPNSKVAYLDAVATSDNDMLFVHIINRSFNDNQQATIDLSEFNPGDVVTVKRLRTDETNLDTGYITTEEFEISGNDLAIEFPPRSITLLKVSMN